MKATEVGFSGSFNISCKGLSPKPLTINLARSGDNEPDSFDILPNDNFQLKNTFLWWQNKNDPELLYRDSNGQLYTVNFQPYLEKFKSEVDTSR